MNDTPTWLTLDLLRTVVTCLAEHPKWSREAVAEHLHITVFKVRTVRDLLRHNGLLTDLRVEAADTLWGLLQGEGETEGGESGADTTFEATTHYFDAATDTMLVMMNRNGRPEMQRVPGELHRALKAAYSHWDGDRATLNQIAREHGVSRKWLVAFKSALGWTHDMDPFTDEEVRATSVAELTERALQRKRFALERHYQRAVVDADRVDAERFRKLETLVLDPLLESLRDNLPNLRVKPLQLDTVDEPFAVVVSPADLHYGKLGPAGRVLDPYDRQVAGERLREATSALLRDITRFGRPQEIIVGMAGDWFHVDNVMASTTKGTPQSLDGSVWRMVEGGVDLAIEFISMLSAAADHVRVVKVRGNHDAFATLFLIKTLALLSERWGNVSVVTKERDRVYVQYGSVLLGFTHGDRWDKGRTLRKILTEPPREMLASTVERVWFTGDKHFERFENDGGVYWYQLPSLSGDDAWHDDEGYTQSAKALSGFILRPDSGVVGTLLAKVGRN